MPVVNDTTYDEGTPEGVIRVLEAVRSTKDRVAIFYGNPFTGEVWGDVEVGTIGRSTGPMKVPLIIKTSRSYGGSALSTSSILRIEEARKPYRVRFLAGSAPRTRREMMAKVYKAWGRPDLLQHMDSDGNVPAHIRNAPLSD